MKTKIALKFLSVATLLLVLSSSKLLALSYFTGSSFLLPKALAAAPVYSAQLLSLSPRSPIKLQPGKALTVELKYKNTGNTAWEKDIFNFTAIATAEPLMRSSKFSHSTWEEAYRPARLLEKKVKPGEIGTFRLVLKAPKQTGSYRENFQLVVRRVAWIDNSKTTIDIAVTNQPTANQPTNPNSSASLTTQTTANDGFFTPTPEQLANMRQAIEQANTVREALNRAESEAQIDPADANQAPQAGQFLPSDGPMFRVGLFATSSPIEVNATRRFSIKWNNTTQLAEINAGEKVTLSYNTATSYYKVILPSGEEYQNAAFPTLTSSDNNIIFKIINYENRLPWNPSVNDNRFRNKIELRYSSQTGKIWVINELPLEYYVKGVSEVSNLSPREYLKAMSVAIRTYAYYHYNKGVMNLVLDGSTKHAAEHFHVDSLYDQVYRGYGIEERLTNYNQAVSDTRGQIVKYQDRVAITPYFSRSDGRTRSFAEVWNNDVPWLVSVPTPYDEGKTLWGHGVGMAATDAYERAEHGAGYQAILTYYYSGVNIANQY